MPKCVCGAVARPNVSMFGDTNFSWKESRSHEQKKKLLKWLEVIYSQRTEDQPVTLAIIEVGCGVSLHSISIESETLIADDKKGTTKLIRINPSNTRVPRGGHVAIGLGGLAALQGISEALVKLEQNPELAMHVLKQLNSKVTLQRETESKERKGRLPGACEKHKRLHLKCPVDCPDRATGTNIHSEKEEQFPIKKQRTAEPINYKPTDSGFSSVPPEMTASILTSLQTSPANVVSPTSGKTSFGSHRLSQKTLFSKGGAACEKVHSLELHSVFLANCSKHKKQHRKCPPECPNRTTEQSTTS